MRLHYRYDAEMNVAYFICRRIAWILEDEILSGNNLSNFLQKAKLYSIVEEGQIKENQNIKAENIVEKRPRDEDSIEILSNIVTKRALLHLIENDDFTGAIKIDRSYLKGALLKLSDQDIVSLKSELEDLPEMTFAIERAEKRIQLDNLRLNALPDK